MIVWEWGVPRTIQGYWDMGSIQIPPLPVNIILTDRADGTLWLIEHVTTTDPFPPGDGFGRIGITTTLPTKPDKITYAAYEEPYVADGIRLIVRGGRLGFDYDQSDFRITDQAQGGLFIRTPLPGRIVKITLPTSITFNILRPPNDTLAWQVITLP